MSPIAIAILVFVAIVFAVTAIAMGVRDWHTRGGKAVPAPRAQLRRIPPPSAVGRPTTPIGFFDRWFLGLLQDSGLRWNPMAAALFLVVWSALCGVALWVWDERLLPATAAAMAGALVLLAYLMVRRARRLLQLQEQLPGALEALARSMHAGRTLDAAIALLGDHTREPLAKEFRWCGKQLQMGLALPVVMQRLFERVRLYDLRIFATTLIVHRQAGGNVVIVLERLARVIRDRLNYRRQLRATTAAGRMSAGLVAMVAPGVFLYFFFFRPEYMATMLQAPFGRSMLAAAVVLEVVGLVWTYRLLRPAY